MEGVNDVSLLATFMAVLPTSSSSFLELTISVPGSAVSPSLPISEGGGGVMRDLDINQVPSGGAEEALEWTTTTSLEEDDDQSPNGGPPRKKLRLTKEQSRLLEESFKHQHTLNPKQKEALAMQLKLKPRQVEVWFQNRRASCLSLIMLSTGNENRSKLKQTEMECEYLKRWFGSLTEQNMRLQKEVEELRAMKVGPPTVMTPHSCEPLPASTLSMCPRCERVTATTGLDKGPTRTTTTTTNHATLSPKVPILHTRHPSAAC
ncbi:hypothetical protein RJ639_025591 [Escallonia herrerae]|uniref:Homeobox domain-containing protein n=1 Tax=Escallonia herrerae TaxID=1293975 RepID=A0AA88UXT8_9ASTE|nr:hypothetical protein RJ639_025591 [Escallonia herrerae]